MKAIVLSAGFGTRLAPLSDVIPKAMFPVLDRSLIAIISSNLQEHGIDEIGVNLYHLEDKLGAHLLRIRQPGIEYFTVSEDRLMGTGGGVAGFREYIDEQSVIVHNCDIITDAPLYEMIDYHREKAPLATMMMVDYKPLNTVTINKHDEIIDIGDKLNAEKNEETRNMTFAGIVILSPEIFKLFPIGERFSIIDLYLRLIYEKPGSIIGWRAPEGTYWRDVGSVDSYLDLHHDILVDKSIAPHSLNIPKEPIFKGFDVFIHANARIEGFASLGHYVRVPKAAFIKNSVIWPGTELPKGFRVERKIVYKNFIVPIN